MKPFESYCVNCVEEISPTTWDLALSTQLSDTERASVMSYVFRKDQERSLLSILLQKYVIRKFLSQFVDKEKGFSTIPENLFKICRTRENKPYPVFTCGALQELLSKIQCTFNYNVSHHGNFVGIASHMWALVGMDIVDMSTRVSWVSSLEEYITIYRKQLSDEEYDSILSFSEADEGYTHFYILWSLKEAYVKAIGVGIGVNLKEVEFDVKYDKDKAMCGTAFLKYKGRLSQDWKFDFFSLDTAHIMTIGVGPISAALETYKVVAWPSTVDKDLPVEVEDREQSIFKFGTTLKASAPFFEAPLKNSMEYPIVLTVDELLFNIYK